MFMREGNSKRIRCSALEGFLVFDNSHSFSIVRHSFVLVYHNEHIHCTTAYCLEIKTEPKKVMVYVGDYKFTQVPFWYFYDISFHFVHSFIHFLVSCTPNPL